MIDIKIKHYDKIIDLQKQFKNDIVFIYGDGSYFNKEYKHGIQYLPSYSFVVSKPNPEKLDQYPNKSNVIYTNRGDAEIPGVPIKSLLANKNITGEFYAVFKALDYANKRNFKRVAIISDLEMISKIAQNEVKINPTNLVSLFFFWVLNNHTKRFANIKDLYFIECRSHTGDPKYALNAYADRLARTYVGQGKAVQPEIKKSSIIVDILKKLKIINE